MRSVRTPAEADTGGARLEAQAERGGAPLDRRTAPRDDAHLAGCHSARGTAPRRQKRHKFASEIGLLTNPFALSVAAGACR